MKKLTSNLIVFAALLVLSINQVKASGIYGQYGGQPEKGKVVVDKLVRNPQTGDYLDNLGLNDPKYSAEASVFFKITVENVGGSTLSEINVVDYLPTYLNYVSGGSYDASTREIRFSFANVAPGERRTTILQAKVYSLSQLPAEKTILCPVNRVLASSVEDGSDEDTAQFCIQKKPMVGREAPKAGDPMGLFVGFSSLATLFGGFKLKRKYA